ncbi:hypothetical protein ACFLV3_04570 [Chloroflexota bacterium]
MAYPDEVKEIALKLYQGRSAEKTIELLRKELFSQNKIIGIEKYTENDIPSARTVRTWRKDARSLGMSTNKISQTDNTKQQVIPITRQMNQHFQQLFHVAIAILGGIGHIQSVGNRRYRVYGLEKMPELVAGTLTRIELTEWLQGNMISAYNENSTLTDCFRQHMTAENSKCQDLAEYAQSSPEELFKLLQLVALRKTFQGKCEVCKDW